MLFWYLYVRLPVLRFHFSFLRNLSHRADIIILVIHSANLVFKTNVRPPFLYSGFSDLANYLQTRHPGVYRQIFGRIVIGLPGNDFFGHKALPNLLFSPFLRR